MLRTKERERLSEPFDGVHVLDRRGNRVHVFHVERLAGLFVARDALYSGGRQVPDGILLELSLDYPDVLEGFYVHMRELVGL